MSHRVFVYGSLLRGLHNHRLLTASQLIAQRARTKAPSFLLVDSGQGYPFALDGTGDERSTALLGEVYEVSSAVLALLGPHRGTLAECAHRQHREQRGHRREDHGRRQDLVEQYTELRACHLSKAPYRGWRQTRQLGTATKSLR